MLAERGFDAGDFLAEVADTSAQFLIHVWRLVNKWARHTHPNKPNGWVTSPVLRPVQRVPAGPVGVR
jgi:hypothetical protein